MNEGLALLHIHQLLTMSGSQRPRKGPEMDDPGLVEDGAVLIRDGRIAAAGRTDLVLDGCGLGGFRVVDMSGRAVTALPGFVDSHTHAAFLGTREDEYEMRVRGASYAEIAARGGGILNSARRVQEGDQCLVEANVLRYAGMFLQHGTTTVEVKSGYGLTHQAEMKLLRSVANVRDQTPLDMVATFLGAHAYPEEFRDNHRAYLDLLVYKMIPSVAREDIAAFCDVFCDRGFFSVDEAREVLEAGKAHGLLPRVHADELTACGGAELAASVGAVSADHLEMVSPAGIAAMAGAGVIAGLLPGTAFNLGLDHYPPARRLIEAGVPVALATDFNPGTCFCLNMQAVVGIACAQMRMTPAEALSACTINGAYSLGLGHDRGSIEPGKRADIAIMDVPDFRFIPYFFGMNHCVETLKDGIPLNGFRFFGEQDLSRRCEMSAENGQANMMTSQKVNNATSRVKSITDSEGFAGGMPALPGLFARPQI